MDTRSRALALSAAFVVSGCGYRAVYGEGAAARLHVKLVRTSVPDVVASDEVAAGLREELSREGALAGGDGYPRVEIEVLQSSEASEGVAEATGAGGATRPVARGIDVGVAARAWVIRAPGASPESDTGDLRAVETIAVDEGASGADPRASGFHEADALRAAARRLGRRLAYKVTGQPAATDEGSEGP